jgi:soluble lytic murein transglycosylase-like protein
MMRVRLLFCCMLLLAPAAARADELCFQEAGVEYSINPLILKAIAKVESNFNPRAVNWNKNGTYDFGVMQINSSWYYTLGKDWWMTLGDPCSNIKGGAKILSGCMKKYGYSWEAIGCYNSQTPNKRDRYALAVFRQLQNIQQAD